MRRKSRENYSFKTCIQETLVQECGYGDVQSIER